MADGLSVAEANALLAAQYQGTSYAAAGFWVQLHIGAPGPAGTANIAVNNTRKNAAACFGTSPSGGSIANSAVIGPWLSVPASETYTHATFWTASTAGSFLRSGSITAAAVTIGDDFDIPAGDLTSSFPTAA
jgi:hypothetical protein